MAEAVTKICHWCRGRYHPASFTRDRSRPDGLDVHCRVCRRDIRQLYRRDGSERPRRREGTGLRAFAHPEGIGLAWRYFRGESYASIARDYGVHAETVRLECARARLDDRRYRLFRIQAWARLRLRDEDSPAPAQYQPASNRRVGESDTNLPCPCQPGQGELFPGAANG
jgi:hypothetical protein